jgi:2-iminobutanoate/2-iminopropanoate deaminase
MKITPVHPQTPEYPMPFVPAMLVEGARYLFAAGCGPVPLYHKHPHDPDFERSSFEGGIRQQTRRTFENIKLVLGAVGADLTNVVRVLIFITDHDLQDEFNEVYESYFRDHKPPRTFVVAGLVHRDMLVEIEVTAVLPGTDTDGSYLRGARGRRTASARGGHRSRAAAPRRRR